MSPKEAAYSKGVGPTVLMFGSAPAYALKGNRGVTSEFTLVG